MVTPSPREPMTRGDAIALIVWGIIYAALAGLVLAYLHGLKDIGV